MVSGRRYVPGATVVAMNRTATWSDFPPRSVLLPAGPLEVPPEGEATCSPAGSVPIRGGKPARSAAPPVKAICWNESLPEAIDSCVVRWTNAGPTAGTTGTCTGGGVLNDRALSSLPLPWSLHRPLSPQVEVYVDVTVTGKVVRWV